MKPGDLLLSLDGELLKDSFDLIYTMKQKHVGGRSTLVVERLGKQLDLGVRYEQSNDQHQHGKP